MYIIWGRGLSEKTENRQDNSTTEKPAGKFDDGASARQPVKAKRGRDMRATLLATGETVLRVWGTVPVDWKLPPFRQGINLLLADSGYFLATLAHAVTWRQGASEHAASTV